MSEEKTTVTIKEDKEVLIGHRNSFRATLIAATLNVKRYRFIKTIKPDFQKQDQQGKYVGIDELIEDDERKAANAKSYVGIIDELLAMDEAGNLSEAWADISETTEEEKDESPIELSQEHGEKKEEEVK